MDLMEWSSTGLLGVIYLGVGMKILGGVNLQQTIVKDWASATNRVDGAPSEGERLGGAGLLPHDVR